MIIICESFPANTATTIGIRIPNVPHDVPVEKARHTATTNIIAGSNNCIPLAECSIIVATNSFAPSTSVIDFNDHANVRIRIAGTIALNPAGKQSIHSENLSDLLAM